MNCLLYIIKLLFKKRKYGGYIWLFVLNLGGLGKFEVIFKKILYWCKDKFLNVNVLINDRVYKLLIFVELMRYIII